MKFLLILTALPVFMTGAITMADRWTTFDKVTLTALVVVAVIITARIKINEQA